MYIFKITSIYSFIEAFLSVFRNWKSLGNWMLYFYVDIVMSSGVKCKMRTYFWKRYFIIKTSLSNLL